jgi:hypothetical protein
LTGRTPSVCLNEEVEKGRVNFKTLNPKPETRNPKHKAPERGLLFGRYEDFQIGKGASHLQFKWEEWVTL